MRVLVVGFGSIGKRHYEVLKELGYKVDILSRRKNQSLQKTNLKKYDYFVIATENSLHYKQLKYIDKNVKNKIIFCEKPLFDKYKKLKIKNNKVYVGYVLRFHPLLQKLKSFLKNEKILFINAKCGQFLPTWRNTDYKKSYSAKKEGGVLLDLSHEIDYVRYLAGDIKKIKSYQVKLSDLEIKKDDLTTFIGKAKNTIVNVTIDYISKLTHRFIIVETLNTTYKLDFIKNEIIIQKDKKEVISINIDRNYMFKEMHKSILKDEKICCSYEDGLKVMKIISKIQKENR